MAEYTTNYNLIKPAQTDFFNVDDLNDNADKIDTALKTNADGVSAANAAIAQNTTAIGQRVKYSDALTMEEIEAATSLTDKVAAAAAAKSLKDALSTSMGSVTNGTYTIYYKKQLNVIDVYIYMLNATTPTSNTVVGTLPSGCRPSVPHRVRNYNDIGAILDIASDGKVSLLPISGSATQTNIIMNSCYIANS